MTKVYFGAIASWAEKVTDREKPYIRFTTPIGGEYAHKDYSNIEKASELQQHYNSFVDSVKNQGVKCFYVVVQLERNTKIRGFEQAKARLGSRQIICDDYFTECEGV
jgi:hypothetical protein